VNPDQYHGVLLALDQALKIFKNPDAVLSADDRQMLMNLEVLRSQILKAESGHPFPLQLSNAGASAVDSTAETAAPATTDGASDNSIVRAKRIRVLLADDYDTVRAILRALLSAEKDFDVVAEARNGQEAVELAAACHPDIIIMDLNMPVLDGISATHEALRISPTSRVLVFSANREPASVRKAIDAGAVGYLCKPANRKTLIAALRDVHQGKTAFPDLEVDLRTRIG
jgi:CheY-like chemotaxis protein